LQGNEKNENFLGPLSILPVSKRLTPKNDEPTIQGEPMKFLVTNLRKIGALLTRFSAARFQGTDHFYQGLSQNWRDRPDVMSYEIQTRGLFRI
jgi:hypothetical protein